MDANANQSGGTGEANKDAFVDFVDLIVQDAQYKLKENLNKRIATWEKWLEEEKEQLEFKDKTDLQEAVRAVKRGMLMEGRMLKRIKRSITAQRRLSALISEYHAKNRQKTTDHNGNTSNANEENKNVDSEAESVAVSNTHSRDDKKDNKDSPASNVSFQATPDNLKENDASQSSLLAK